MIGLHAWQLGDIDHQIHFAEQPVTIPTGIEGIQGHTWFTHSRGALQYGELGARLIHAPYFSAVQIFLWWWAIELRYTKRLDA